MKTAYKLTLTFPRKRDVHLALTICFVKGWYGHYGDDNPSGMCEPCQGGKGLCPDHIVGTWTLVYVFRTIEDFTRSAQWISDFIPNSWVVTDTPMMEAIQVPSMEVQEIREGHSLR